MNEPMSPVTLAILAVTALCTWRGFTHPDFLRRCLFSIESIRFRGQYERMATSALVHADWGHFLFNMISLYSFGTLIELSKGWATLLFIYLSSILGGSLLSLVLHRREEYRALGASGGVCGVIFAAIFLFPGMSVYIFFIPIPVPSWLFAIAFVAISFFGMRTRAGNIGHDAHLGGAIVGLLVTTLLDPLIVSRNPVLYAAVLGLSVGLFVFLYRR
jgi:membrane associated rhomboid family serine protease